MTGFQKITTVLGGGILSISTFGLLAYGLDIPYDFYHQAIAACAGFLTGGYALR